MALESVSYLDDLVITNPVAGDPRSEGDDHLRNIKIGVKASFPGMTGRAWRVQVKGAGYTIVAGDNMSVLQFSGAYTASYTAAATLGNGHLTIIHASGGAVTIDPDGAELVNGAATLVVPQGSVALVLCDGTGLVVSTQFSSITANRVPYATATNVLGSSANLTFDGTTLTTHTATVSTGLLTASGGLSATTGVFSSTVTLSGTAANIALGSNFLSGDGGDEGVSVDASGNVTCSGTLAVNGASITTDDTTFACFNTTAMTVNAFGEATALTIGASTGVIGLGGTPLGHYKVSTGGTFTSSGVSSAAGLIAITSPLIGAIGDTSFLAGFASAGLFSITTAGGSEVYAVLATMRLAEPTITLGTGDIATVAATLYIANAPTEGETNAALYVASGATYLLGDVIGATSQNVFNTVSTTVNAFGAATTLTMCAAGSAVGVGAATTLQSKVILGGTYSPTGGTGQGVYINLTLTGEANSNLIAGLRNSPIGVEAGSGTHAILAGSYFSLSVSAGSANVTTGATAYFAATTFQTTTDLGATVYISGPSTGATTNAALYVASGATYLQALNVASTLTLSGTAANIATGANFISYAGTDAGFSLDSGNNVTLSGTLDVNGAAITMSGAGPHAFGTAVANNFLTINKSFTGSVDTTGAYIIQNLTAPTNGAISGVVLRPKFITAATGEHALALHMHINPQALTDTGAAVTLGASLAVYESAWSANVVTAATLYIRNAPTLAGTNYALFVDGGSVRFDNSLWVESTPTEGTSGEQLTSGGAATVMTWAAAACEINAKRDISIKGELGADAALELIVDTPIYAFHYKDKQEGEIRHTTTGDTDTEYVGPMAHEAPWVMHHGGRILNPINAFGYSALAIKALESRLAALENRP